MHRAGRGVRRAACRSPAARRPRSARARRSSRCCAACPTGGCTSRSRAASGSGCSSFTTTARSFEGTTEPVTDEDDPPASGDVERALELFRQLQQTVGSTLEPPSAESPLLDFEIVSRVDFGNDEKQELIELTSPNRRFVRLVELLEHALEALTLERAVMRSAAGNGKVTPLSGE